MQLFDFLQKHCLFTFCRCNWGKILGVGKAGGMVEASRGYANFPVGLIGALMRTSKINDVQL